MTRMRKALWISILVIVLAILAGAFFWRLVPASFSGSTPTPESESSTPLMEFNNGDVSLSYPPEFSLDTSGYGGGSYIASPMVRVSMPRDVFKSAKSNFSEAYLTVAKSNDPNAAALCASLSDLPSLDPEREDSEDINGTLFKVRDTVGAAAGNIYESRVYRAMRGDFCYEISLTVHTTNIGNYPEGTVVEFDVNKAYQALDKVLDTFRFVD